MTHLTERQAEVLRFIKAHILEHGFAPTLREIGNHFGIRSTNGVNDHLNALERKGYLTRGDMKSRALRPIGGPEDRAEPKAEVLCSRCRAAIELQQMTDGTVGS